jgi:hypothetical protein
MSSFPLATLGAIEGHAMGSHIFNLQAGHIAAAQPAVDAPPCMSGKEQTEG